MISQLKRIDCQPEWDALCPEWKLAEVLPPREKIILQALPGPICRAGEHAEFSVLMERDGKPLPGADLYWKLECDFAPVQQGCLCSQTSASLIPLLLTRPGFARLEVSGEGVTAACGIGFSPDEITAAPVVAGFSEFWEARKAELRQVPVTELYRQEVALADASYAGVRCYDVRVACAGKEPVSGYLALPENAAPHSLPAYLFFHGAGVRSAFQPLPWAKHGMLAFNVNALGLENGKPLHFYQNLAQHELLNYESRCYETPRENIFCDMTLRVLRALEYIKSRPEWDGRVLVVHGGSQGGYQSLAAAGLDKQVTMAIINAPAMCNLAGALEGRNPSWPWTVHQGQTLAHINSALFFDGASFALSAQAEAIFSVGFSDPAATPSSIYATYHNYKGIKHILDFPDLGHEGSVFWTAEAEILEHVRQMK